MSNSQMFRLELEKLLELDPVLYEEAVELKGIAPHDAFNESEPEIFGKMYRLLKREGAFYLTTWSDNNIDDAYSYDTTGILGCPTFILDEERERISSFESAYVLIGNGSLFAFNGNKIVDINEVKVRIRALYDLVEKRMVKTEDYYDGIVKEYRICGECKIESARDYFLAREQSNDLLVEHLRAVAKEEMTLSKAKINQKKVINRIAALDNQTREFEQLLIRQNSGFNPSIELELRSYRQALEELFELKIKQSTSENSPK